MSLIKLITGLLFAMLLANAAHGQEYKPEMGFAGFAYSGESSSKAKRFPYIAAIENDLIEAGQKSGKQMPITTLIRDRLGSIENKTITITNDKLIAVKGRESALSILLLLTGETVLLENYGSYWKIFINIRGDAFIFDAKSKQVIVTYPLNLVIFDADEGSAKPNPAKIKSRIREYLFTQNKEGLISQFLQKAAAATLPKKGDRTFQVGPISVKPEALGIFPSDIRNMDTVVKDIIADSLASELSSRANIALMPSKVDRGATGQIRLTLEDGAEEMELRSGDIDYSIKVDLNKFVKIKQKETDSQVSNLYGIWTTIQVMEPQSNKIFLDSNFKNGEISITPITKLSADDFPAYYDTLNGLFKKLATALKTRDYSWVKVAASSEKINEQMTEVSNLIEKKGY